VKIISLHGFYFLFWFIFFLFAFFRLSSIKEKSKKTKLAWPKEITNARPFPPFLRRTPENEDNILH